MTEVKVGDKVLIRNPFDEDIIGKVRRANIEKDCYTIYFIGVTDGHVGGQYKREDFLTENDRLDILERRLEKTLQLVRRI